MERGAIKITAESATMMRRDHHTASRLCDLRSEITHLRPLEGYLDNDVNSFVRNIII